MTEQAKTELEVQREELEAQAEAENKTRTGKGTRVKVGSTRGKNPQPISFENFDDTQPDTLPKTLSEFMDVAKVSDENVIVSYLIDGYNQAMYSAASDPVKEYVNPAWSPEMQKQFRIVVRQYASGASIDLETAVNLIKPGIEAAHVKSLEKKPEVAGV